MQTSVTFKNFDSSENLKSYIKNKLDRFDKLLDNPAMATVVLSVQKFRRIAEVNISGDRLNIKGTEETEDMYSAIDKVLDKLEKQIKKSKQKIRERRGGSKSKAGSIMPDEPVFEEEMTPGEIMVRNIEYKPMDIEEARMQMDIIDDNFLVFTNSGTNKVNVLYHRKNGGFGLIQPSS